MKLYVWKDVLEDYTEGVMFALAESPDEARKILIESGDGDWIPERDLAKEPQEYPLDKQMSCVVCGGG